MNAFSQTNIDHSLLLLNYIVEQFQLKTIRTFARSQQITRTIIPYPQKLRSNFHTSKRKQYLSLYIESPSPFTSPFTLSDFQKLNFIFFIADYKDFK
jgi:hypothetical protein